MKILINLSFVFCFLSIVCITSCTEDDALLLENFGTSDSIIDSTGTDSLDDSIFIDVFSNNLLNIFDELTDLSPLDSISVTLPISELDSLISSGGLKVKFPTQFCSGYDTLSIQNESITVTVKELYKRSQFISHLFTTVNKPVYFQPTNDEYVLVTAGAFHLDIVDSNGNTIFVTTNSGITAEWEDQTDALGYENLMIGHKDNFDINSSVWWDFGGFSTISFDGNLTNYQYQGSNMQLGWNAAMATLQGNLTGKVEVVIPASISLFDVAVFFISDDYSTVIPVQKVANQHNLYTFSLLPVGMTGHVVGIGASGSSAIYAEAPYTIGVDEGLQLNFTTETVNTILTNLENFD